MKIQLRSTQGVIAALVLSWTTASHGQQSPARPAAVEQVVDVPGGQVRVVTVAAGLFHPWSLAFLPDGRLLVAERDGRLRIIRDSALAPTSRGSRYFSCASSTCHLPSRVRARRANISRINCVRSTTLQLTLSSI